MDDDCKDSCGIGNDFSSYNDGGFCPINDDNSYSNQGGNDFSSNNDGGFCPINDDNSYSPPPPYPGNNENITINNFSSSTSYNDGVWSSGRYSRTSGRYSETRPLLNNGTDQDSSQSTCSSSIGCLLVLGILIGGALILANTKGKTSFYLL